MNTLLDTNILTRGAQPGHPMHAAAVDAVDVLAQRFVVLTKWALGVKADGPSDLVRAERQRSAIGPSPYALPLLDYRGRGRRPLPSTRYRRIGRSPVHGQGEPINPIRRT